MAIVETAIYAEGSFFGSGQNILVIVKISRVKMESTSFSGCRLAALLPLLESDADFDIQIDGCRSFDEHNKGPTDAVEDEPSLDILRVCTFMCFLLLGALPSDDVANGVS